MEIEIKFNEVFNAPDGVARPRFSTKGRYVHTYMPTNYTKHKKYLQSQMPKAKSRNASKIELAFYFTPPESWSKKKKAQAIGHLSD